MTKFSLRSVLLAGLLSLLLGFTLQLNAETLATIPTKNFDGTTIFPIDTLKQKAFMSIGQELTVVGVILISIAAFRGTQNS
jgi:hypothetical protein